MKRLLAWRPVAFGMQAADDFLRCGAAQSAAALSYFLILTLFPLLLCLNYFIGLFHLNLEQILDSVHQFLPAQVLNVIGEYLRYASQTQSIPVFVVALVAIVISASAALRSLFQTLDRLYDRPVSNGPGRVVLSVVLSILFLLTIYLSVVVIFTGDWFFRLLEDHLPRALAALLPLQALSSLWGWVRYLFLFCFVLLLVLAVYRVGIPRRVAPRKWVRFSALITAAVMVAGSLVFSWFLDLSSRYSLLYGSLASLIILLVWLYFCGNVLLLGAVVTRAALRFFKVRNS